MSEPTFDHDPVGEVAGSSREPSRAAVDRVAGLLRSDPFEFIADSFVARYRAGERPSVEEYAARYPELADQIRELLPALVMVEQDLTSDIDPAAARGLSAATAGESMRLGDYSIIREIGRGGMGVVYEAEQVSLGRRVALKVLPDHVARDRKALERFRREAKAAARLHHTNIVPVFEVGRDGGVAYYAMQFIQGQGLDQVIGELARLRDPERKSGGPRSPGPTAAGAATGLLEPTLGRVAESLLSGQFATERAIPLPGDSSAPADPAATERFDPHATSDRAPAGAGPDVFVLDEAHGQPARAVLLGEAQIATTALFGRRPLFFRSVAHIGRQAAQGLAYSHARGIVHRDIKPSNLLLDHAGVVWIADFGLARADDEGVTETGEVLGTLRYMAPERFRSEGDARADIYALGMTLYELLTLHPAYDSPDRLKLIERIKSEEPPRPRSLDASIPRDLETIVLKAIDKDPKRRYQSAELMAGDLRRFLDDEPILARRASAAERYARWARHHPGIAALGAVLTAVLVAGVVVSSYFAIRATRGEGRALQSEAKALAYARRADVEAQLANQEAERARVEKLLSDRRLYQAEISLAQQAWRDGQMEMMRHHLQSLVPERPEDPDLRGFEWYYLHRPCQSALTLHGGTSVAFSPDGGRLVGAGADGTVRIWDAATGREVQALQGHQSSVTEVSYSPDGRQIASASTDQTVKLWDAATGQVVHTLRGHAQSVMSVSYSLDGRHIASGGSDLTVRIWDASTGHEVRTLFGHSNRVNGVAYSPDGRTLASASLDQTVRLWDTATGRELHILSEHMGEVNRVAYSPDGRTIVSSSSDQTVRLWDAATGQVVQTLRGQFEEIHGVAYSPNGRQIASASLDQTVRLWDAATGQELRTLRGYTTQVWSVAYSPDGRRIAAAGEDETVRVWDISADQEAISLHAHAEPVWGLAYSPDGGQIASASPDRTVKIWDAATGQEIRTLRGHTAAVWAVAYHPDGRTLASASHDHTLKLWDPATGREVRVLRGHEAPVLGVSYSPDGRTLASASVDRTVRIWDAATGQEVHNLHGHRSQINDVSYSPDGRSLATASSDQTAKLWNAATGQEVYTLRGHTGVVDAVAFSPDGRTLASASFDHTLKLWEVATGQEVRTLRGQSAPVRESAFTPDGRRIASGSNDGTVRIWDANTGQELLTLRGHKGYLRGLAYSPDGRTLASAGADGTIKLWDATPLTPEAQATREARGMIESLFEKGLTAAEVLAHIRHDAPLSAAARQRALAMAESYGQSLVAHEAERVVAYLFAKPMFRPEVLAILRRDASLAEPVRREALALAQREPEDAGQLDAASWKAVIRPGAGETAYRLALRRAEAACRLIPNDGGFLNTLGIAQYRVGLYKEALATLSQAERLNTVLLDTPLQTDLAFLALTQHRLGRPDQVRAALVRLRESMKREEPARIEEWQVILREALELDMIIPADPFAPGP